MNAQECLTTIKQTFECAAVAKGVVRVDGVTIMRRHEKVAQFVASLIDEVAELEKLADWSTQQCRERAEKLDAALRRVAELEKENEKLQGQVNVWMDRAYDAETSCPTEAQMLGGTKEPT